MSCLDQEWENYFNDVEDTTIVNEEKKIIILFQNVLIFIYPRRQKQVP